MVYTRLCPFAVAGPNPAFGGQQTGFFYWIKISHRCNALISVTERISRQRYGAG